MLNVSCNEILLSRTTFREQTTKMTDEALPLENRWLEILKDGKSSQVPALHFGWAESMCFLKYEAPTDFSSDSSTTIEEWLEKMEYIEEDFNWVLHLPHHRFWSQVKYDVSLHNSLLSYLNYAPRYFDLQDYLLTAEMKQILQKIHRLVFLMYLRMSTYKESKTDFITPDAFAEIIYSNFLFDIPKIMDLCVLYGLDNKIILKNMLTNIFNMQPQFKTDFSSAVNTILKGFSNVTDKVAVPAVDNGHDSCIEPSSNIENISDDELQDIIVYIVDISATLFHFCDVYPDGCSCFNRENFVSQIPNFYENTLMVVVRELDKRCASKDIAFAEDLKLRLSLSRSHFINLFRNLLVNTCIQPMLNFVENSSAYDEEDTRMNYVEDLLQIYSAVLSESRFVRDYNDRYSIEDDLCIVQQLPCALDDAQIDYILQVVGQICKKNTISEAEISSQMNAMSIVPEYEGASAQTNGIITNDDAFGASAGPAIQGAELYSLITQVKDLLPELGDGFIEDCLQHYNYNPEHVINAILEGNLPAVLNQIDRSKERCQAEQETPMAEPSVLDGRRNIYDNDEFDVFNRGNVDTSKIHIGKKDSIEPDFLDDDRDGRQKLEIYERYANVVDEQDALEYDDEYDDTYDSNMVGTLEPDADVLKIRPFTTPMVLRKPTGITAEQSDSSDDEEDGGIIRDQFVQNPAVLREKAEQRRQSLMQNRYGSSVRPQNKQSAVKGKPGGQGQDDKTVKNRLNKEKNKGARANHNRRALGDKKRSRGMLPN